MAELEIHHEDEHGLDSAGRRIGVLSAFLAVLLAWVTIASHRSHNAAIMARSEANDLWEYYQSERLKLQNLTLGQDLLAALADSARGSALGGRYESQKRKLDAASKDLQKQAREKEDEAHHAERKALRYDFGEGLLEIGLVLTSLFFIARRRLFPTIGLIAGCAGLALGIFGLLT